MFQHVKVTFKGKESPVVIEGSWYDFYIKDGVIAITTFDSKESKDIIAATIYNPSEIKMIGVW